MSRAEVAKTQQILIVEDEAFVRHDLLDFFSDRGFAVFEAEDAAEAIEVLAANPTIRVVLSDIQMPGAMDGICLAHYIRGRYPPTLLILVSGRINPASRDLPDQAIFVSKPFDPRFILGEIERYAT